MATPHRGRRRDWATYAAVASLVWTSGVRAKNALDDATADAYLMFAADYRARLRPPLSAAFFGNCAKACYARTAVGGLRDAPVGEALARAAAAVREAVREQLADPLGDAERWTERRRALPPGRVLQVGASKTPLSEIRIWGNSEFCVLLI
ncbi:hydroxycinnamoyltransferase 4-like [Panicum virgatum]|uniref:hydroxycinnamoyltransferase 4-like n=1 Tax=Panicum virgatum TaxID=38727 RepID=UPI0019D5454F|nr:hydroxycinnamoyltransferase 4-like [Panicum virgatum]